jgi:hypothetical protein
MLIAPDVQAQRIADLLSLVAAARRCQHTTHLFAAEPPTEWDRRHADIDAMLDALVGA